LRHIIVIGATRDAIGYFLWPMLLLLILLIIMAISVIVVIASLICSRLGCKHELNLVLKIKSKDLLLILFWH
jgi:hypothetical protein